jgi:CysZ protein
VLLPLFLNTLVFAGLFWVARHEIQHLNAWIMMHVPYWLQWLGALVWLIFLAGFVILMVSVYVTLANIIAAPFNALLAEKVERSLSNRAPVPRSWWFNVTDAPRIIARQCRLIFYFLWRALLILFLFLIPIVHLIAPWLWLVFNAWYLALTCLDYPCDNHHYSLRDMHAMFADRRWLMLGFGSGVLLASMVPVLNLLAIPAAVAGATHLFFEQCRSWKEA